MIILPWTFSCANNNHKLKLILINIIYRKQTHQSASSGDQFFKDNLSPTKSEDLSLFEGGVTVPISCGTNSSPNCPSRRPLDDIDASSLDSGYGTGFQGDHGRFLSYASPSRGLSASFGSSSICSMEDDFFEDFSEITPLEKNSTLPKDFNKLISDPLVVKPQRSSPKDTAIRPLFRRALSLQNPLSSGKNSRVRTSLFVDDDKENKQSAKRPEPPTELEPPGVKRTKLFGEFSSPQPKGSAPLKTLFTRQFSATEESIKCAVQRSSTDPDLIADFSRNYCLPLTNGRHKDLKSITPETLARLINGQFNDSVESYKVIDCRYPYEFKGGHIAGAVNLYTKEQIAELLLETRTSSPMGSKRRILVFHCEFSSERGPNL